jgi:uncharacterized protein (TIGR03067 family)
MWKRSCGLPVSILFLVLPLLGSDSPKDYDESATVVNNLEGTWKLVEVDGGGKKSPVLSKTLITIRGRDYISASDSEVDHGTFVVKSAYTPPRIYIVWSDGYYKGQTMMVTFRMSDKDTLIISSYHTITTNDSGPVGFDSEKYGLWTYKRQ